MLKISLIAAAAICAVVAPPAFAQDTAADTVQHTVSYADLDLSSPAGVATLNQRIESAVSLVCGHADSHKIGDWLAMRQCRDTARGAIAPTIKTAVAKAQAQKAAATVVLAAK